MSLKLACSAAPVRAAVLLGEHPTIVGIREIVARAASSELPVLIQGETGTGKEIVARALHVQSGRRGHQVSVNVAAIPEALAEAEFFGVARGAFTGASADRPGRLEECSGGTLYLDEAADLSIPMQARLLRVLETGEVRRVGAASDRFISFRLLLSIQSPAADLVRNQRWRTDFLYRVSGLTIALPRLSERGRDILLLANHFLTSLGHEPLPRDSDRVLLTHRWPGNVRELRLAIERSIFAAGGRRPDADGIVRAAQVLDVGGRQMSHAGPRTLQDVIRTHIREVLASCGGDARTAARVLGISRATVYRQLQATLSIKNVVPKTR